MIGPAGETADTGVLFPWWSFTKTVLAVCALQLVAEDRTALDAPMPGQPFTLRQVLQHRAGLPDYGAVPGYHRAVAAGEPAWSRDRMIAEAGAPHRPGGFAYSNIGYRLVREAVEHATGRDLAQMVRDGVSGPLALRSVFLAQTVDDMRRQHWQAGHGYDPNWVLHGLLIGTAADAARLLHALMTGALLPPDMLAEMLAIQPIGGAISGRIWQTHGYGLGLMGGIVRGKHRAIGHSGAGPFSSNACYHFADLDAPVTVACFGAGPNEAASEHAALALAYPKANNNV